jgi:hypothetical protein
LDVRRLRRVGGGAFLVLLGGAGLKDRLKRLERQSNLSRIVCTTCGERRVTGEDVELGVLLNMWLEGQGRDSDARLATVEELRAHEHVRALVYEDSGLEVFGEFPRPGTHPHPPGDVLLEP